MPYNKYFNYYAYNRFYSFGSFKPNTFRRIPRRAFGDFQTTIFIDDTPFSLTSGNRRSRTQSAKMQPKTSTPLPDKLQQSEYRLPTQSRKCQVSNSRRLETYSFTPPFFLPSIYSIRSSGYKRRFFPQARNKKSPDAHTTSGDEFTFLSLANLSAVSILRTGANSYHDDFSEFHPVEVRLTRHIPFP